METVAPMAHVLLNDLVSEDDPRGCGNDRQREDHESGDASHSPPIDQIEYQRHRAQKLKQGSRPKTSAIQALGRRNGRI